MTTGLEGGHFLETLLKADGSPKPICNSVDDVDDTWVPLESTTDAPSSVMPCQYGRRTSRPTSPDLANGANGVKRWSDQLSC